MTTYKITNITDKLGKRDVNFNTTLKITYIDQMERKNIMLKPNSEMYLTTSSLPISLHRYRVQGLVSITEISEKELKILLKKENNKTVGAVAIKPKEKSKSTTTTTTTKKKRTYNKKDSTPTTKSTVTKKEENTK